MFIASTIMLGLSCFYFSILARYWDEGGGRRLIGGRRLSLKEDEDHSVSEVVNQSKMNLTVARKEDDMMSSDISHHDVSLKFLSQTLEDDAGPVGVSRKLEGDHDEYLSLRKTKEMRIEDESSPTVSIFHIFVYTGYYFLRVSGQGALYLTAVNCMNQWFIELRGRIIGLATLFITIGMIMNLVNKTKYHVILIFKLVGAQTTTSVKCSNSKPKLNGIRETLA
jgi:hypothetical protein